MALVSFRSHITQLGNQGGGPPDFTTISKIFFLKSIFWGTIRSQRPIKLSADSLEVTLQDSNKILNFSHFFRFLLDVLLTLLMQKTDFLPAEGLRSIVKNDFMVKKCGFFKVEDTSTIIIPLEKRHINSIYLPLKPFLDNLRGLYGFLQKSKNIQCSFLLWVTFATKVCIMGRLKVKYINFWRYLKSLISCPKMVLGLDKHQ